MDSNVSAWTLGASIFSFAALYILFIGVATALYIVYTKPGLIPGHRVGTPERPVIHTPRPGMPSATDGPKAPSTAEGAAPATEKAGE